MTNRNSVNGYPAIEELPDGDFLVVGYVLHSPDTTAATVAENRGLGVEPGQRAVIVPRSVFRAFVEGGAPGE